MAVKVRRWLRWPTAGGQPEWRIGLDAGGDVCRVLRCPARGGGCFILFVEVVSRFHGGQEGRHRPSIASMERSERRGC